ncbi:hypothetical protein BDM02DRAFT_3182289 [Thelephora ganbajun]|uniref:Uncharacterized protein n=1 Tax=Thelephora ganbajun TaxID=370292 RepID=A0ACB6ZX15_THEGA|nr:hypothetical protein BDM02DRAFT_3182289 [Thelephora ganbajun]
MNARTLHPYPLGMLGEISLSYEGIVHGLWVERELRITATEPTFLLIAWVFVPAWSLWQAFGPQKVKNIEEGLVFPPFTTVAAPVLLLSLLTAFVASTMSVLSQLFLPATIRNTPPTRTGGVESRAGLAN